MLAPALVMLGIGLGAGAILAAAAKAFYVEIDPRITAIEDVLPAANCGGCGYAGCGACAEAIVLGKASVTACVAGGPDVAVAVARVMGDEVGFVEPKIAQQYCTGGDRAELKFDYEGAIDCRIQAELHGGDKVCGVACLGGGTCVRSCQFGALEMGKDGYPIVFADRCTGCGNCEKVCPVDVIKVQKTSQRLLHFNSAAECLPPCKQLCPAQIDIPGYIDLASKGKYREAIALIKERNPLPLICGRVCPAPCEDGCRRAYAEDDPVHHNYIKRFVADWEMNLDEPVRPTLLPDTGKKIGIIGGGPCGLSAAYYLRILGHTPVIIDAKPELGGMLRYGIPEYRLPKKVLDFEIKEITELGVEVRVNTALGKDVDLADLREEFDATLIALGAWDNSSMRCAGEDLPGVWGGTTFLQQREMGVNIDMTDQRVVVVGGGNTAMDAARSSLRQGAREVILLYRRTRKEMPANVVEIIAAEHEGVIYKLLAAPTRLLPGEDGKVAQIEYLTMELGEPDASGRRRPVPIEGSETLMDVDVVIKAIGQRPLLDWYTDQLKEAGLELTRWNTIVTDDETLQAKNVPDVFCAGDLWSGPALLIDAVGTGRRAAAGIDHFVKGEPLGFPAGTFVGPKKLPESHDGHLEHVAKMPKVEQPELEVGDRITNYKEVDLVLTQELMEVEAARCLRCGTLCYFDDEQREEMVRIRSVGEKVDDLLRISPE